jgi:hypothetical protein
LADGNSVLQQSARIVQCLINAVDPSDFVAACLPIDDNIRIPIACALRQTDRQELIACAAAAYLNGDQRRILSCALTSQSYFEFGVCASDIKLNREWAIATKCAGTSGGDPYVFAGCTAGQLTVNELQKCKNGIGIDDGCFGPSNTIIKTFADLEKDLHIGPVQPQALLLSSVSLAAEGSRQFSQALSSLVNSLDTCAKTPANCPDEGIKFCQNNPVMCATVLPIPGNPISKIDLTQISLPPAPAIPAPPCRLQWKCDGWQCGNMC